MQHFLTALARAARARRDDLAPRRWLLVLPDQLTHEVGPLARWEPRSTGIVLVESGEWLRRRPYHRQKIAAILLHQRSFAMEASARGVAVRYVQTDLALSAAIEALLDGSAVGPALRPDAPAWPTVRGPLVVMEPAEREVRTELAPLVARGALEVVPNETWLTTDEDFRAAGDPDGERFRMDRFYRQVRRRTGILMEGDEPVGGQYSFDHENRKPWRGEPEAVRPPRFRRTPFRDEVEAEIHVRFSRHPGTLDIGAMPATAADVRRLWSWARTSCLPHFGPYEDAMSSQSRGLFHTRISPILNLGRILPRTLVADAAAAPIPIASKEGFVRQVLGWREFVRHVHRATDGFRRWHGPGDGVAAAPGDGGFRAWRAEAWTDRPAPEGVDGGATPNALEARMPLPQAYWGRRSGLACLDRVVADVWAEGWSHHITRLMVLSNIATLLGVSPRELTDWFWVAYADAYDWVVEPNVLAMGTFAVGDLMTTKPYVAGASYIDSMSDSCAECVFRPDVDCPLTSLYWHFLERNGERLAGNERMAVVLAASRKRPPAKRRRDAEVFLHVRDVLVRGERLTPQGLHSALDRAGVQGASPSGDRTPASASAPDSLFP